MAYRLRNAIAFLLLFAFPCFANSPHLSHQETDRFTLEKSGPCVGYILIPEGFPKHTALKISTTGLDQKRKSLPDDFFVDDKNEVRTGKSLLKVFCSNCAKGEPITYTIETKNKRFKASTKVIPFPIEVKDEEGHCLSLEHVSPKGEVFHLGLSGYKPSEVIQTCSQSENEKMVDEVKIPESDKALYIMLLPAVVGKKSGHASYSVTGENGKTLTVNYQWGLPSLQPYKG